MSLGLKPVAGRDSTVCGPEWQSQGEQGIQCSGPEVVPTGMQAKLSEGCLITSMPSTSVLSGLEMAGVEGLGGLASKESILSRQEVARKASGLS